MTTISPPPFIEKINYKNCQQITDKTTGKRVYVTPDGERLPSVTTILSATKDMTHLNEWKKRVGVDNAARITKESAGVGTSMHNNLERFVTGLERKTGNNLVHAKAHDMATLIIEHGLSKINEIWTIEQSLYFPGLYSGTTDLAGVYNNNPAIIDYKQTLKPKKEEWVEDYKLQLMAYILAHNEVYGTDIREGHVFMCSQCLKYQQFDLWPQDFNKYQDMWLSKVEEFYTTKLPGIEQMLSG